MEILIRHPHLIFATFQNTTSSLTAIFPLENPKLTMSGRSDHTEKKHSPLKYDVTFDRCTSCPRNNSVQMYLDDLGEVARVSIGALKTNYVMEFGSLPVQ